MAKKDNVAPDEGVVAKGDAEAIVRAEATEGSNTTSAAVSGYRAAKEEAETNPNVGVMVDAPLDTSNVPSTNAPEGKTEFKDGEQPPGHETQQDQELRRNIAPDTELEELGRDFDASVRSYKKRVRQGQEADKPVLDEDKVAELARRSIEH